MIERAKLKDIERIEEILYQVHDVHASKRPDIFKKGEKKYTRDELKEIIEDDSRPIFVYKDESDKVLGYVFCVYEIADTHSLQKIKTLYIDDLCVDQNYRRRHIASDLYDYVLNVAKENECYHVTLNVWCLNEEALSFYERMGMDRLKIVMEKVL